MLLDNGRSQAYRDEELRKTLQCIRCGACMNHCPVYTRIGGHAYGTIYPGPIGKIISPHLLGLESTSDLVTASSLCGACGEVCPVRIPIPDMLQRLRREAKHNAQPGHEPLAGQGAAKSRLETLAMQGFAFAATHPRLYHAATGVAGRLRGLMPKHLGPWTQCREAPKPAPQSLHALLRQKKKES